MNSTSRGSTEKRSPFRRKLSCSVLYCVIGGSVGAGPSTSTEPLDKPLMKMLKLLVSPSTLVLGSRFLASAGLASQTATPVTANGNDSSGGNDGGIASLEIVTKFLIF